MYIALSKQLTIKRHATECTNVVITYAVRVTHTISQLYTPSLHHLHVNSDSFILNTTFCRRISTARFKLRCNVDNVCMTISREWLPWFQFPNVGFLSVLSKFKISAKFLVTFWCELLGVVVMERQTRGAFNRNQTTSLHKCRQCLCLRLTSI